MHTFYSQQWIPLPADVVFAFFANPANLPRLMPSWQQAKIVKAVIVPPPPPSATPTLSNACSRLAAGAGSRLTLSFRPFPFSPVRLHWEAEIDSFLWNARFSDIQIRGPFAKWHHTHKITPETRLDESLAAITGTLVEDEVQYQLPLGKFGDLTQPLIARELRSTFEFRHRRTRELL